MRGCGGEEAVILDNEVFRLEIQESGKGWLIARYEKEP